MQTLEDLRGKATSLPPEVQDQARYAARNAFARARLLQPYLANFMGSITLLQTEEVGNTFAVSPDMYLIYNPAFILGLNEAGRNPDTGEPMTLWEYGIAFLHESLHIVFNHFERFSKYRLKTGFEDNPNTRHLWNIAGDCEINVILREVVPINPNFEALFTAQMGRRAGTSPARWDRMLLTAQRREADKAAMRIWKTLPLEGKQGEGKYPIGMGENWPTNGVSLPEWFCFPETSLYPPQGPKGTAESYYPFVPKRDTSLPPTDGPKPPPPPPPPWGGWTVGDRVVNQDTGEVGVITQAGPYNPDATPPQEVEVTVTNHFTESVRKVEDAVEIGVIARAKAEAGYSEADIAATKKEVEARNKGRATAAKQARSLGDAFSKAQQGGYAPMGSGVMKWTTVSGGVEHQKMQSSNGVYTIETLTGGGMVDEATTYLYKYVDGITWKIEAGPMSEGWDGAGGWDIMDTTDEEIMEAAEKDASGTANYAVVQGNPQIPSSRVD